jgi:uncharacterized glyoxalase superfamily protein PhnB
VSGNAVLKQYAALSGTTVYGLSRRPSESRGNVQHISVDLLNAEDIRIKLGQLKEIMVKAALSNQKVHEDVGWDAYLWVTDARRACEEIRARGGRVTREIEETYYGCREFEIEDLNGLSLCFGQELSPEEKSESSS